MTGLTVLWHHWICVVFDILGTVRKRALECLRLIIPARFGLGDLDPNLRGRYLPPTGESLRPVHGINNFIVTAAVRLARKQ
jgi:hypothetical protein